MAPPASASNPYSIKYATLPNGIEVFYREAGNPSASTVLLLHGFPSSSHQYRNLIPILAQKYHVVAPDFPGFGFTRVPDSLNFKYSFETLTDTTAAFLDVLKITHFTPYIFDYGAPVGLRLALRRPDAIKAIITQNGNAYTDGFGEDFWGPLFKYWKATSPEEIKALESAITAAALSLDGFKAQYFWGLKNTDQVAPESYTLDYALVERPGNKRIQLDILRDYGNNVPLYPKFHEYFRNRQPKVLAAWGKHDICFIPPGAEAYKRDLPNAEVHLLDAGHFALETNLTEIADLILDFLQRSL